MIKYGLYLNEGNEALNLGRTITANELPDDMTAAQLAREISHDNPLVPESVAKGVIDSFCRIVAQAMAEGRCVNLCNGSDVFLRLYADVHLAKTFDLKEAKARGYEGSTLTEECFTLIQPSDLVIKAHAEVEQKFTDMVRDKRDGLQRTHTETRAYIRRKTNSNTPTTPSTDSGQQSGGGHEV